VIHIFAEIPEIHPESDDVPPHKWVALGVILGVMIKTDTVEITHEILALISEIDESGWPA
jgi:hypothetical protein